MLVFLFVLFTEPFPQTSSFLLGALPGAVLLVLLFVGVFLYVWRRKTRPVCQVKVKEGAQSITLSYQTTDELPEDATVEWTISDPEPKVVHRFENGHHQPGQQHEYYFERTEMANPLQTGDLSLTLSDPCCDDSGIYICTVHRGRHILAQKVVEVRVQRQYCTKIRATDWIEMKRSTVKKPQARRKDPDSVTVYSADSGVTF
ncbi:uncharacterized protein LOC108902375 isoform X3 [Lates calcarifer]|uniref:Uncharacterized protein LOC108902375 isoform X3 n=1 Tax=Lates calcarifer TaxID=8187 RepID=A0AAJ8B170_LATCA|nr:uncharacterized protein LOC108902375 isoform X3 [Lates calcarifer]